MKAFRVADSLSATLIDTGYSQVATGIFCGCQWENSERAKFHTGIWYEQKRPTCTTGMQNIKVKKDCL